MNDQADLQKKDGIYIVLVHIPMYRSMCVCTSVETENPVDELDSIIYYTQVMRKLVN